MTGQQHRRIAEELLESITKPDALNPLRRILKPGDHYAVMALAQAHATLAVAAATADNWLEVTT